MFNHILVPLDGSLLAERAISHAEQLALVFGGKITLLQVLDSSSSHEGSGPVEPLNWQIRKAEAEMYLQGAAARIQKIGITANYALREGRTPDNIIDFAHRENVDLMVLSTHGASGLSRWNTSSVASKLLEKIYLPVLLVRAYQETEGNVPVSGGADVVNLSPENMSVGGAAGGNISLASQKTEEEQPLTPTFYQRILLPIDTSRRAECAYSAATTLVRGEKSDQVTLVLGAVINPPDLPIPAPYPEEIIQLINRFMQLSRNAVENYLNELSQRLQVNCESRIVENDNISAALHELVEHENIDLVVLCAHGQTGGTKWPYGSVARNYLEHGTKTVLVIQDVPLQQVRPTAAEIAAEKQGRR
jgi:nucleotide-binding universal stress UspA family protein